MDTANEAASNTQSQLLKLRELAVRSANGTLSAKDIEIINQEADQIIKSIDKTASSTSFAGVKLLDGTFTNKNFAVTNSQNGSISIAFDNLSHEALGLKNLDLSKHVSKTEYAGTNGKDTLIGKIGIGYSLAKLDMIILMVEKVTMSQFLRRAMRTLIYLGHN